MSVSDDNPAVQVNYAFIVDFIQKRCPLGLILDYGCGAGEVVRAGLAAGINIYGCEVFYEGGATTRSGAAELIGTHILEMKDSRIPFPAEHFDCVVTNMVLEHVQDIDLALSEIRRVLKPHGLLLSLFPSREVLRENHCGVPLAHRFSHYRIGYYWLLLGRCLGFGHFTEGKTRREWAANFQRWLNSYCFYRSEREIFNAFKRHHLHPVGFEREYLRFRSLPLTPWLFRRLGSMVLLSRNTQTDVSNCT